MGVVSTGSSVPCSRSPTTAYPATIVGSRSGTTRRTRMALATAALIDGGAVPARMACRLDSGPTTKLIGSTAIVPTTSLLRR